MADQDRDAATARRTRDALSDALSYDAIVVGGGLAGLTMSLALAARGLATICLERQPVGENVWAEPPAAADNRTTAVLQPGLELLESLGVWRRAAPRATRLRTMRMIDVDRGGSRPRKTAPFEAGDVGADAFGANIANADLRAALLEAVAESDGAQLRAPARIARLARRDDAVYATLSDGTELRAAVIVAADGRDSGVRDAAGIRARRLDYGQSAVVCLLSHDRPHGEISTEIHRTGGPFTLTPYLDAPDGAHRSGLVWMERASVADALARLPDDAFAERATERSLGVLGPLRAAGPRRAFPVISLLAERFRAKRLALAAEAAHVAPPTGAQGLNMSLRDAQTLADILGEAKAAGRDIGGEAALARYERQRWPDVAARVAGTAALNAAAIGAARPIRDLRALALAALYDAPPVRKAAIRFGLGG